MTTYYPAGAPGVRVVISENEYSTEVEVFRGDERALYWDNRANVDYPEDLTWSREISEVFWAGVELGRKLAEGDKSMRKWAIRATREELYQEKIGGNFEVHEETEIVALFSTEEAARGYIKKATLKNPQRRRGFTPAKVFRKASLLSGYDYAEVEIWGEPDYPLDPEI
jgi:hypothetical protein